MRAGAKLATGLLVLAVRAGGGGAAWDAVDRLGPLGGAAAGSGWRVEATGAAREALPGELETGIRLESGGGLGVGAAWTRFWIPDAPADDLEVLAVLRRSGHRLALRGGATRLGEERTIRIGARALAAPADGLVLGGSVRFHPGEPAGAPEIRGEAYAAAGIWLGALTAGPAAGAVRVVLGLRLRHGLTWTAAFDGSTPAWGVGWRWGGAELRGETAAHPFLGRVHRVRLVWGGLPG